MRFFEKIWREESGADGSRTHDLFVANEALSQLSYSPKKRVSDDQKQKKWS